MLSAVAATSAAACIRVSAAAFRFDRSPKGVQHTVVVEVPLEHLTFEENRRVANLCAAVHGDDAGQGSKRPDRAALRASRIRWRGRSIGSPALKRGRLRFKRQLWLPPGRYTLWTIARDQATERSSVKSCRSTWPSLRVAFGQRSLRHSNRRSSGRSRDDLSKIRFGQAACG